MLQAIARDELFPGLKVFGFGTKHGDEPRYAVIVTFIIALVCLLIGDLDVVAPIITSFFCESQAAHCSSYAPQSHAVTFQ